MSFNHITVSNSKAPSDCAKLVNNSYRAYLPMRVVMGVDCAIVVKMEDEEKGQHDWKPCSGLKDELLKCLKESTCVVKVGLSLKSLMLLM